MRRLGTIALLAAFAAALAIIAGASAGSAQGNDTYTFAVVFDDARGLVSGQLVKIAGAQAGTIQNVTVTPDYKARITASVPAQFRFHIDATCTIRPQGLIAENYVECDPGSASKPLLRGRGAQPPTVPVTQTTEPVSLQDLFNIFNLPTRERIQVLIDELGIATAGEGDNLNAVLERANPALKLANQVSGILAHQNAQLADIIDSTSRIAAQGATHTGAVRDFISRADQLTQQTAAHGTSLSLAIHRLPGLLSAAQPALTQLDTVARDGTPLLSSLRSSAPDLDQVNRDIGPFARVAGPALTQIDKAITSAIPAIHQTIPLVNAIAAYIRRSAASTALFAKLSINLQAHGFVENFLSVVYYVASSLARYDSTSHLLSILLVGPDNGTCGNYDSGAPIPACSAHYGDQPAYNASRRGHTAAVGPATASRHGATRPTTRAQADSSTTASTLPSTTTAKPAAPKGTVTIPPVRTPSTKTAAQNLQNLLGYLLK